MSTKTNHEIPICCMSTNSNRWCKCNTPSFVISWSAECVVMSLWKTNRRLSIKKRQVKITTFQEKQKTFHFLYFCTYLGGAWNLTIMNIDKNSDGYKNYVESILLAILRLSLFDAKYINAITRQRTMSGFFKTAY